uniref:Protein NDRG2 n=3 Tax=Timema TaxID=61471 RepID=A0A7R9PK82_TIMGE|nr:unnamed protein product [Timema genevievae]
MPAGVGGSYRSLADDVYKSTTVAEHKFSVLESVKKAFSFAGGPSPPARSEPLLASSEAGEPRPQVYTVQSRDRKMPTSVSAEETALLGTMPSDSMDDIELKNIQLQFPTARTLARGDSSAMEERVETARGSVLVAVQGNRNKPAILTYHDLGLNYISSFQAFFNYIDMRALLENFCVYHVNAPGQEEGATTLPEETSPPPLHATCTPLTPHTPFIRQSTERAQGPDLCTCAQVFRKRTLKFGVSNKPIYSPGPAPPEHCVLVWEPLLTPRLRMMRIIVPEFAWKTILGKTTLSTPDRDSSPNLPVTGSPVDRESDLLDQASTEAAVKRIAERRRRMMAEDLRGSNGGGGIDGKGGYDDILYK